MRKAFFKGGNSTCRFHLRQHYERYKEKCGAADVAINHWAIPRKIWQAMEEEKELAEQGRKTKKQAQQLLAFESVVGPREFTRGGTLHAMAKLISTNNQVGGSYILKKMKLTCVPISVAPCPC
jgi:hypothetical protein